jgi:hypothetical protein
LDAFYVDVHVFAAFHLKLGVTRGKLRAAPFGADLLLADSDRNTPTRLAVEARMPNRGVVGGATVSISFDLTDEFEEGGTLLAVYRNRRPTARL